MAAEKLTAEVIAKLKRDHGDDLRAVPTVTGEIVFRRPTVAEWTRYQDSLFADRSKVSAAGRELQSACVVWPNADAWRAALDARPALLGGAFGAALNELAGVEDEATPRKL
jgi:hypothetical protein